MFLVGMKNKSARVT